MQKTKLLGFALVVMVGLALPATAFARVVDGDHDKLPDRWELRHHFSPHAKSAAADTDHDGLSNLGEYEAALDPRDGDTDDDGIGDGAEDTDNDGVENGMEEDEGTEVDDADSDDDGIVDGAEEAHVNKNDAKDGDPTDGNAGWGNDEGRVNPGHGGERPANRGHGGEKEKGGHGGGKD